VVEKEEVCVKMSVVWTGPARMQLADLYEYIAESNTGAAERQSELIVDAAYKLTGFPEIGRQGRRRGTRELVVPGTPFIMAYRIRTHEIEILAIMHGAQRWPRRFDH
jgi:plasmid stabilization system protein ParE